MKADQSKTLSPYLDADEEIPEVESRWGEIWYGLRKNPTTIVGLVILLSLVLVAVFAPLIAPYGPEDIDFNKVSIPPGPDAWLGTDQYGFDIFSRIVWGTRIDLTIAVVAVSTSMVIGTMLGAVSGFRGGWVDEGMMRVMDIVQAFPRLIFAMGIAFAMGPGLMTVIIATAALNIPGYARLMRNLILSAKTSQYASAAIMVGNFPSSVLFKHLVPNCLGPIFVQATLHSGWAILEAAGLSFIGLGVPVPTAEWGVMISMGLKEFLQGHWWTYTFPGLAIMLAVLGFNLLGDGLQDILDPKHKT